MMEILSQVKNSCKSVAASQCCCSTPLLTRLLSNHPQRHGTECIWDVTETTSLSVQAFSQGNCRGIFIHTNATHCILLLIRYILGKPKRWWVVKIPVHKKLWNTYWPITIPCTVILDFSCLQHVQLPIFIEFLPCDWLINYLCEQAIEHLNAVVNSECTVPSDVNSHIYPVVDLVRAKLCMPSYGQHKSHLRSVHFNSPSPTGLDNTISTTKNMPFFIIIIYLLNTCQRCTVTI